MSGDHPGLKKAIAEVLAGVFWQRYVHFLRNALDYVPRNVDDDCLPSCAGCTTGATFRRCDAIWPPGLPNGAANTPSSPLGGGEHRGAADFRVTVDQTSANGCSLPAWQPPFGGCLAPKNAYRESA